MPDTITLTRDPIHRYEVDEYGRIFVETRTRLLDADGNLVSEQVHRGPFEPGGDIDKEALAYEAAGQPMPVEKVKALATLVRTPERLARAAQERARATETPVEEVPVVAARVR